MSIVARHSLQVRAGHLGDAGRLAVLGAQVWLHTYATDGVNDEIAQYVLSEFSAEKFSVLLRGPETCLLVAEYGGCLVGYACIKLGAACPHGAKSVAELGTLYVQEHFIGQGIGRLLLQAAETEALERAASPLWLTVNAKNARAIAFYARQGYANLGTTHFVLGKAHHENHVLLGAAA